MSDDQTKLIELQEKFIRLDQEKDALEQKLRKHSTWWKNPAMLTALTGMLAGVAATSENIYTRYIKTEETQKEEKVEKGTHRTAYRFLMKRQDEIESMCSSYAQIVVEVLTPTQRRQVSRKITELGLPSLGEYVDMHPPAPVEAIPSPPIPEETPDLYDVVQKRIESNQEIDLSEIESEVRKK